MFWVVVVDDDAESREHISSILTKRNIKVTKLSSGKELLNYVEGMVPLPDLILLDVYMDEMDGFETLKAFKEKPEGEIPVIFLTGDEDLKTEADGLHLGAVDFIRKPVVPDILSMRVIKTIEFEHLKKELAREVEKKTQENIRLTLHVVQTLAEAIDAKDAYTNGHSGRVAAYSKEIAKRYGYDESQQDEIYMMGLLHDVGKIGVPDWIINKTSRLTDEEFAEIKKHPVTGNNILKRTNVTFNVTSITQQSSSGQWVMKQVTDLTLRLFTNGLRMKIQVVLANMNKLAKKITQTFTARCMPIMNVLKLTERAQTRRNQ